MGKLRSLLYGYAIAKYLVNKGFVRTIQEALYLRIDIAVAAVEQCAKNRGVDVFVIPPPNPAVVDTILYSVEYIIRGRGRLLVNFGATAMYARIRAARGFINLPESYLGERSGIDPVEHHQPLRKARL